MTGHWATAWAPRPPKPRSREPKGLRSPSLRTRSSAAGAAGAGGETAIVAVSGPPINKFSPGTITITVGETVTWRWAPGAVGHNVTPDNGTIPAGEENLFSAPHDYSYTFTQAGTYTYHCAAHGAAMSGTVVVEPAS